jgi:hypothetical protein
MKPTILLAFAAALIACTDYGVVVKDGLPPNDSGGDPEPLEPAMVLSAEQFEQTVCTTGTQSLTLSNQGEGLLEVYDLLVNGEGWTFSESPKVPFNLDPGASESLTLEGSHGSASLMILSNDPTSPTKSITLLSNPDVAPVAIIVSPSHETLVDVGADLVLEAQVSDDMDAVETLNLSWVSSLDGALYSATPDTDGKLSWSWPATNRTKGPHQLELTALDSCGNTHSTDIQICQQTGYKIDQLDISTWHFEGNSTWDTQNNWLELTSAGLWQEGSAFQTSQTITGDAVSIEFLFYIGDGTGADGISLTALDTTRMTTYLGSAGCGIGYGGDHTCANRPGLPGWSIEVDTYFNPSVDPTEADHLMFTFDGDLDDPAVWAALPEMEDTGWHTMKVDVAAPHVTVSIDGTTYIDDDLNGKFNFPAFIGFTAGTGLKTNVHLIDSLEVTETVCE